MRKSEKNGPNFLDPMVRILKNLHIRNPHIKSDNLAKTESLLIFVKQKLSSGLMWVAWKVGTRREALSPSKISK